MYLSNITSCPWGPTTTDSATINRHGMVWQCRRVRDSKVREGSILGGSQ